MFLLLLLIIIIIMSQAEEKEFIRSHDRAEAHIWYLVDVQWLQALVILIISFETFRVE